MFYKHQKKCQKMRTSYSIAGIRSQQARRRRAATGKSCASHNARTTQKLVKEIEQTDEYVRAAHKGEI